MFVVDELVNYMRNYARGPFKLISGASNFERAKQATTPAMLPQAFIIPLKLEVGENEVRTGYIAKVTQTVSILVEYDNTSDNTGEEASQLAVSTWWQLNSLIMWGYVPQSIASVARNRGFRPVTAQMLDTDRARLWWEYVFEIDFYISDADGVQPNSIPLTEIDSTNTIGGAADPVNSTTIYNNN